MNVRASVAQGWASARLRACGVASPQAEARTLLAHITGLGATELLLAEIDQDAVTRLEELVGRRCAGEPLQHLTGRSWFRNVELLVGPGVFIPRPETELVAGAAIADALTRSTPLVVELCAGSGAISAAIVDEVPDATVIAVEREDRAAQWTRRNLDDRGVRVVQQDMADALPELDGLVDIVVANPPYIPWSQRHLLPVEVREHDPEAALFADDEGLAAIRIVAVVAGRLLAPGGFVVIEHGDDQGVAASQILSEAGFTDVRSQQDLAGRDRFVTARWPVPVDGHGRMEK